MLFTIKDREVKDNKYVKIFHIWLSTLIQNGGLNKEDVVNLLLDAKTFAFLKTDFMFNSLYSRSPCPLKIHVMQEPETIMEGMMFKYIPIDYTQDVYFYCDIDILITNPLHNLTQLTREDTIYIQKEGKLNYHDYNTGAFSEEEIAKIPPTIPGLSAGKFMIRGKNVYNVFVNKVLNVYEQANIVNPSHTFDQPFFNKAVYSVRDIHLDFLTLAAPIISVNGHHFEKGKTILLDMMGMAGDGDFHYDKAINMYMLLQCGAL